MNDFGGKWTFDKIDVFIKYLRAYMEILKMHPYWKLIYFDGFAGSGEIKTKDDEFDLLEGVATRVLSLEEPRGFDIYYFVDKSQTNSSILQGKINEMFPNKNAFVTCDDCNKKILDLAEFLRKPTNSTMRGVVFIDPYGMQVKWESLEALKGLHVDLWILVPTGTSVNRMLKKSSLSSDNWFVSLGEFFGLDPEEIKGKFYQKNTQLNMFGEDPGFIKKHNAIQAAADLYRERLLTIFKFVSKPLPLKNSTNAVMFHFFLASNVEVATKIANDIIKKRK